MSGRKQHGSIRTQYFDGVALQPGSRVTEINDGTLQGTATFKCDARDLGSVPGIGSPHPQDGRMEMTSRDIEFANNGEVVVVGNYFGLQQVTTKRILAYVPNTDQEPITSAPQFTELAGTVDSPNTANGAVWDEDTGEFLGFYNPAIKDLFGVGFILSPSSMLISTYWTSRVPDLRKRFVIVPSVSGFRKPPDVKELLLLDTPYQQIGSFYQVQEHYMGSGPDGWSRKLYPQ
jgi:hypothetical protein